jgi:putative endopeptidase
MNLMPQDDFYNHINAEWLEKTTIPEDRTRWGTFNELDVNNTKRVHKILTDMNNNYDTLTIEQQKLVSLWQMSDNFLNGKYNNQSINVYIEMFNNAKTKEQLMDVIFELFHFNGISSPINFFVYSDFNNSDMNILHIGTGGLGLPDREYYFEDSKKEQLQKYKEFIVLYMSLFNEKYELGLNESDFKYIFNMEQYLAEFTYTNVQQRDTKLMNNKMDYSTVIALYKCIGVDRIFKKYGVEPGAINIINPNFLNKFCELWEKNSVNKLRNYYLYLFLRKMGNYINMDTYNALFNFYSKYLSGVDTMRPQWERTIDVCDGFMGMVIGKSFVQSFFKPEQKEKVDRMISLIINELERRLLSNDWMSDITKEKAIEKLNKMSFKVGYPLVWRDFTSIDISRDYSYLQTILNCYSFENEFDYSYLYKPKDKNLWFMSPHEVNAYYSPSYNEIVFPAGILMEPFFYSDDMARSFGGIGAIIGHEITHGFDDKGREYDGDGNFNDWWNDIDVKKYKERTDKLREQFDNLTIEGHKINGSLTLGENIADLGGVSIAYSSMLHYFGDSINEDNKKAFFENYATIWKCKTRREEVIKRLSTDPHSPPCYRVNQILSNFDEFYKVYGIDKGHKLYLEPEQRAVIW